MEFTDTNFLSLDYMLVEIIELLKRDMDQMRRIVIALGDDADAKALAQEALGAAKAHLEILTALAAKQPA
jgi:hypothetical protein